MFVNMYIYKFTLVHGYIYALSFNCHTDMWFLRRMQRISYTEHVTNVEVLRRANPKRKLLSEMVNRQVKCFGHIMHKEEMENLVTTGYVEDKRARDRKR